MKRKGGDIAFVGISYASRTRLELMAPMLFREGSQPQTDGVEDAA